MALQADIQQKIAGEKVNCLRKMLEQVQQEYEVSIAIESHNILGHISSLIGRRQNSNEIIQNQSLLTVTSFIQNLIRMYTIWI
jgi:hypothetical protein